MEKVKLTKDQADLVEEIITERTVWDRLMDLSREELGLALSGHYELVPETPKFLVGDWVVRKDGHPFTGNVRIGAISRKTHKKIQSVIPRGGVLPYSVEKSKIRHATPEEIYWMETLGRKKVADFRAGDVLVADDDLSYRIGFDNVDLLEAKDGYEEGVLLGIYPDESFKPFPREEIK